ncbi:pantoate--beta-alanine ligase [Aureimonas sp. Leaf454]|uniref:pantoate--beta-alanine ligase n=1 Tax=Aureimonas sp. Leaf454 TaxID=1736381 RepID=UPI0006F77A99|nr:pantoate--beta-alanine ligase [Aureimonas sp. Leaf454]KQT54201.1 pantoate--beta-alanine ligase [Aureimonas sp. Leaf454]
MKLPLVTRTIAELRAALNAERRGGRRIGLVPTMGYLHRGHMALVDRARDVSDTVVVSIFVNPTQFGPGEDLSTYPRDLHGDLALCARHGVAIVFAPDVAEMYPQPMETAVEVTSLSGILIGAQRPGHFRGVATVVAKLFNIVAPDVAVFGEKDYQQLATIRRMVRDLSFGIEILGVPTVRDADGLAASSRNVRLSAEDRRAAAVIPAALDRAGDAVARGERDPHAIEALVRAVIQAEPRADIRSVDVRDADDLSEIRSVERAVVLVTVRFGDVLLIDQREVSSPDAGMIRREVRP